MMLTKHQILQRTNFPIEFLQFRNGLNKKNLEKACASSHFIEFNKEKQWWRKKTDCVFFLKSKQTLMSTVTKWLYADSMLGFSWFESWWHYAEQLNWGLWCWWSQKMHEWIYRPTINMLCAFISWANSFVVNESDYASIECASAQEEELSVLLF